MVYECVKSFCAYVVDGDELTEQQNGMRIKKGSMWKVDDEAVNVTMGDVHMEDLTGMNLLTLSRKRLSTHFKEFVDPNESTIGPGADSARP